MNEKNLREELEKISKEIENKKLGWRFNYSVGLPSGSCFGSSWEDDSILQKKKCCKEKE
jgi:hypothetical protein